jgi:DeoR/GlpR family transcriptional regulator of sugar metabolism
VTTDQEKQLAAEAAAELVEDGMLVGLGTGSTVAFLLPALAARGLCACISELGHGSRRNGDRIPTSARGVQKRDSCVRRFVCRFTPATITGSSSPRPRHRP